MTPAPPSLASRLRRIALLVALTALSGCASAFSRADGPRSDPGSAPDAGLRPGDRLAIAVWREPELSDTVRVDEEGRVVLPLLGVRHVAGIDAPELERQLEREFARYIRSPSIEVTALRRISVLGAVTKPGLYTVDATVSLSEALALAGGITPHGNREDVRLLRDGHVVRSSLDRSARLNRLPIQSGDQVFVEDQSWLARNWRWLTSTGVTVVIFGFIR